MSKSRITQPSQPSSGETSTRFTTPSMPSPAIGAAATSDFFPTTLRLVMRLSRPSRSRVCCDSTRRPRSRYNHSRRQARRSLSLRFSWDPEKALVAPNPDDAYAVGVQPVDDAERRMDDLAKLSEPELRHHPAALRELGEALDLRDDLAQQPLAHIGSLLLREPGPHRFQVVNGGVGESDAALARHVSPDRDAA